MAQLEPHFQNSCYRRPPVTREFGRRCLTFSIIPAHVILRIILTPTQTGELVLDNFQL